MQEIRLRNFRHFWRIIELSRLIDQRQTQYSTYTSLRCRSVWKSCCTLSWCKYNYVYRTQFDPWKSSRIRVRAFLDLFTVRFFKAFIYVSEAVRDSHVHWGIPHSKICVIYPSKSVVPAVLSKGNMRKGRKISPNDFAVTNVGSLCSS